MSRPNRTTHPFAALVLCAAAAACTSERAAIGSNCTFNGDCEENLVCAAGYCRQQCATDRDCASGFTCVPSNEPTRRVCVSPTSPPLCTASTDCNLGDGAAAVCTAQRLCSPACTTNSDCASFGTGATCTAGAGCALSFGDGGAAADDAGAADSGTVDSGVVDSGATDRPVTDAGELDASGDGGLPDGSVPDGSATDGATDDSAVPGDAGMLRLAIVSGDGQTAAAGSPLAAVTLRLTDTAGTPAGGVLVRVTVPDGASATPPMGTTNVSGEFTVSLRFGLRPGPYAFTASAPGADPVTISATATGPAAGTISSIVNVDHSAGYTGVPGPGTSARLRDASAFALAPDNTLYIADDTDCRVLALSPGGQISSIAGNGTCGYAGDGALATAARLANPQGLALDAAGRRLYVAERGSSHRVRVINLATGVIDTLVGGGTAASPGFGDGGPARAAALSNPGPIALGPDGMLYIADQLHNRIRRVDLASNTISAWVGGAACASALTLTGCGTDNCAVAWDAAGRAFVSGLFCGSGFTGNRTGVARLDGTTFVTVAGGAGSGTGEGILASNAAVPNARVNLAFDAGGNLLISLESQHRVRRVESNGRIRTLAGGASGGMTGDGSMATAALLNSPRGIALDAQHNLYIADSTNGSVRVVWSAGSPTPLGATLSVMGSPTRTAVATERAPTPLFAARVVDAMGAGLTAWDVAWQPVDPGVGVYDAAPTDGSGLSEVAVRAGLATGMYRFRAALSDIHGQPVTGSPLEYTVTATAPAAGTIISPVNVSHASGAVLGVPGAGTLARLTNPWGLAAGSDGTVYVSDYNACRVFALSPAGELTRLVGTGTCSTTGDGGPALGATLNRPTGLAVDDAARRLYVAEYVGNVIRVIDLAAGTIDTFAGGGTATGAGQGDGGPARTATLTQLERITLGPDGYLYVPDNGRNRIRRVELATRIISTWHSATNTCTGAAVLFSCGNGCSVAFGADRTPFIAGQICGTGVTTGGGVLRGVAGVSGSPGVLTRYAGGGPVTANGDDLPAVAAFFPVQFTMTMGPGDDLYLTADGQHRVRRVAAVGGLVRTVAGTGTAGESGDYGPAAMALLRNPRATVFDRGGHLVIADHGNGAVRMVW